VPGYAAALADLGDAELGRMLARRPDLLAGSGPATFPELASRAGTPASLAAALRHLDLGALQLAELLAVIGLPTTVDAVAEAAGPGLRPERLRAGLAALAELGLALPGPDGSIAGARGLRAPFGNPGGLGPSVAELAKIGVSRDQLDTVAGNLGIDRPTAKPQLIAAVASALADPSVARRVLGAADEAARRLLDEALEAAGPVTVMGVGYGRFAGYPDAAPASWLLERGLLLPVSYNQFVIPREAVLGLRGGRVFPDWPEPPARADLDPLPDAPGRASAAAMQAVVAAEGLVTRLDRRPLGLIQAGTVAVRDLRRLAAELDVAEDEAALLVDLLVEAEVIMVGGPWDQRSLGLRPEADAWLAQTRARRWADLAVAWRDRDLAFEDHLLPRYGLGATGQDKVRPLSGRRLSAAATRRRGLVEVLARMPDSRGMAVDALGGLLRWRMPLLWSGRSSDPAQVTLDAAAFLGLVVVAGGRAGPGPAAAAWCAEAGPGELAAAMGELLPDGAGRFLVAGDLTVVAPGGLAPDVESRLAVMADRESAGGALTWRIEEASLRRAFDEGLTGEEVLAFLHEHSDTPLPQALEYLVEDAARRHGRLRVGGASTYLRGEPALVTQMVRSGAGRRLGLRELAAGVAVTHRPQRELLAALRKAGEAPVAEEPDGTPRLEARKTVRHAPRAAPGQYGYEHGPGDRAAEPGAAPTEVVARLRASSGQRQRRDGGAADPGGRGLVTAPAGIAALCQRAAGEQTAVEIAYRARDGQETVRTVEPYGVRAGLLTAWCRLRQAERHFDLSQILWARPVEEPRRTAGSSGAGAGAWPLGDPDRPWGAGVPDTREAGDRLAPPDKPGSLPHG
jgi:hypothetical protein